MQQLSLIPGCSEHGTEKVWIKDKHRREGGFFRCRACNARDSRARNARDRADPVKAAQLNAYNVVQYHAKSQEEKDARNKQIVATREKRFERDPLAKEITRLANNAHKQRDQQEYPDKYREGNLKKNYGISLAEYEQILAAQGGRCKICGSNGSGSKKGKNLFVDHCHSTKQIRGLLCHGCNAAIGLMKEDTLRLHQAIEYLNGGTGSFTGAVLNVADEESAPCRISNTNADAVVGLHGEWAKA